MQSLLNVKSVEAITASFLMVLFVLTFFVCLNVNSVLLGENE
jgi:hypothetical protein